MFWIGRLFKYFTDAKVEKVEIKRDISHIKKSLEGLSGLVAKIDGKLDADDDRAADFNTRLLMLEVLLKHENSGFHRVILGADKNAASQN